MYADKNNISVTSSREILRSCEYIRITVIRYDFVKTKKCIFFKNHGELSILTPTLKSTFKKPCLYFSILATL